MQEIIIQYMGAQIGDTTQSMTAQLYEEFYNKSMEKYNMAKNKNNTFLKTENSIKKSILLQDKKLKNRSDIKNKKVRS